MTKSISFFVGGTNGKQINMNAAMGNRHGIVSGATGTGKTVTLQILAEAYSRLGVPVFMADVKGDLSGISVAGKTNEKIRERIAEINIPQYQNRASPVIFWDIFGESGHPVRATLSELGPLLLSSLMELNDTQTGIMYSAFKIADDNGMLLLDLKDLRSMLAWIGDNSRELSGEYGNFSAASIGAIQRRLLVLEEQGAENFFGEPALKLEHLMQKDFSGNGVISLLDAKDLVNRSPRLYATFLLWLLSEMFENFPEQGDADRPSLVVFFDEAHLLFDRAPKPLLDKIEQVVRLIRSKGVGVYFITQSPLDIPEDVLGQLGMRIQHALRSYTPKDVKAVRTVAESFRPNPEIDTVQCITELGIGEALVSVLDEQGSPTPVERIFIRPPESQIGPINESDRDERLKRSPLSGVYDQEIDRQSAYEMLKQRAEQRDVVQKQTKSVSRDAKKSSSGRQSVGEAFIKSAARSIGSHIGRQLIRGVMGSLLGGGRR